MNTGGQPEPGDIAELSWLETWSEVNEVFEALSRAVLVGLHWLFSHKVLQISCTIAITVIVLILLSLIFWRYRVYYYNQFFGLQKSVHQWSTFESSSNPKYCSVCRQLISGFWIYRNTGWECNICSRTAHLNCLADCERLECKTPSQSYPLEHKFLHGNLRTDSLCYVCGTICSSNFGLSGIRCLWCNRTLHEECAKHLVSQCDLGPFSRLVVPPSAVELAMSRQQAIQLASARYVESMGSQIREGFQQVQEAMSAGLKEGFKEVSMGVRRINDAIKKQFYVKLSERVGDNIVVENDLRNLKAPSGLVLEDGAVDGKREHPRFEAISRNICDESDYGDTRQRLTAPTSRVASRGDSKQLTTKKMEMYKLAAIMPPKADVWSLADQPHALLTHPASTPLLIFVNSKSGGQAGASLMKLFFQELNPVQVVDIQAEKGPSRALEVFMPLRDINRLRVLVCGGDGTVGWVMNELYAIYGKKNRCLVPVGILPLGTGNDLANILGWGSTFDGDVRKLLSRVQTAESSFLDIWQATGVFNEKQVFSGAFENYMDIGVAARIALRFHRLRESHPELFQSRLGNKFLYGEVGVREFLVNPNILLNGVRIWCDGKEVVLPEPHIEGLCAINIPSFAGGVKLWQNVGVKPIRRDSSTKARTLRRSEESTLKVSDFHQHESPMRKNMTTGMFPASMLDPELDSLQQTSHLSHLDLHTCFKGRQQLAGSQFPNRNGYTQMANSSGYYSKSRKNFGCKLLSRSHSRRLRKVALSNLYILHKQLAEPSKNPTSGPTYPKKSRKAFRRLRIAPQSERLPPTQALEVESQSLAGVNDTPISQSAKQVNSPPKSQLHSKQIPKWIEQSINDQIIEVVAFRSLFHLAQVQVGLAGPLKVCQGREIQIHIPETMPCQLDGEPSLIAACTLTIRHKCKSVVLMPTIGNSEAGSRAIFAEVLHEALRKGTINLNQKIELQQQLSRYM